MNFYKALQHAFIGYGIRRKPWKTEAMLYWEDDLIRFTTPQKEVGDAYYPSLEDIHATDWEVV